MITKMSGRSLSQGSDLELSEVSGHLQSRVLPCLLVWAEVTFLFKSRLRVSIADKQLARLQPLRVNGPVGFDLARTSGSAAAERRRNTRLIEIILCDGRQSPDVQYYSVAAFFAGDPHPQPRQFDSPHLSFPTPPPHHPHETPCSAGTAFELSRAQPHESTRAEFYSAEQPIPHTA